MTISISKVCLALTATVVLAACGGGGGTSEPIPAEGEVATTLENTAGEVATAAEGAVAEATEAVDQAAETVTAAADDAGWNALQENWQDSIGNIKDRWAELTEEELLSVNGDREQLVSLVQEKYGLDRETAEGEVNDWASSL